MLKHQDKSSCTERNPIGWRTQTVQTADAIRLGGGRYTTKKGCTDNNICLVHPLLLCYII
ncbi:hypothetical protein HMPREF0673_02728 [Leyella stercorea DSM 18206]|uniref:Uncharacterized protein n=1 Tax=Leyella stercorea DSM 18206 TaxID=1002367 RepID=G6B1F7_9BACT|nr:hypothetical protein HMPREF0673_02728 [Leyella stercorea DSM 18206]